MQTRDFNRAFDGAAGGFIAGLVVMIWFFVLDLVSGQPLATPSLLASAFLHHEGLEVSDLMMAGYTILHFGVFVVLGIGAALFLQLIRSAPRLVYGFVFGVGVLEVVHYGGLLAIRAELITILPAVHVVVANVVGGMALMAYLHRAQQAETPLGLGMLKYHPLMAQGVVVGLIGALTVAVWFLVLDALAGRPMFTPAALGSAVFLGVASAAEVQVTIGTVAVYTALHVAAFIGVGVLFAWVAERVEHTPGVWLLALMAFIVVEAGFLGAAGLMASWVLDALGWWAVAMGNVLAVSAMGWRIWATHPLLRERLFKRPVETMV